MPADFLSRIISKKKQEVSQLKKKVPLKKLEDQCRKRQNFRNFHAALKNRKTVNIIAEIKRASPSKGDICIDLNPEELAHAYMKGGASALSVLTDTDFFKGSNNDLIHARRSTDLPVLRKDFTISSYQIYESCALGADAVLLIARILTGQQLKDYFKLCTELGMDALVEIHSYEDLNTIQDINATLIGINNRNLASFNTDTQTAVNLSADLNENQIPVAASGIATKQDIILNLTSGINSFLIGESLVRADDTVSFLTSLVETHHDI